MIGGRFCTDAENNHIDFLWSPTGTWNPTNPNVNVAQVKQLIKLSVGPVVGGGGGGSHKAFPVTPNAAIPKADPDKPSTEYTVAVTLGKDSVTFNVNGKDVWSGAAKEIDTNGIAGIRVNHNLSVHVQSFAIHKTGG